MTILRREDVEDKSLFLGHMRAAIKQLTLARNTAENSDYIHTAQGLAEAIAIVCAHAELHGMFD